MPDRILIPESGSYQNTTAQDQFCLQQYPDNTDGRGGLLMRFDARIIHRRAVFALSAHLT